MQNNSVAVGALTVSLGILIAGSASAQQPGNPLLGNWGSDLAGVALTRSMRRRGSGRWRNGGPHRRGVEELAVEGSLSCPV
jgi:hypothetical protein